MLPDLKTWTCGHCQRTILVPPMGSGGYFDALYRIREHRFGHLVEALNHGSDEDLWGLSGDEPADATAEVDRTLQWSLAPDTPPVDSDDVAPVLAGITELLRADLPRARKMWYPINEDGGFNR